jgi:hypothetical protein
MIVKRAPIALLLAVVSVGACVGANDEDVTPRARTRQASQALAPPTGPTGTGTISAPPWTPPSLDALCTQYSGYDKDSDGIAEIASLTRSSLDDNRPPGPQGVVLVLIEKRVVTDGSPNNLKARLGYWREDLALEGLAARFVETDLYAGPAHQDGLTVLALRDFVKSFRSANSSLRGVVMVGHFPDASLVSRTMRAQDSAQINGVDTAKVLSVTVNRINPKSDLVLGDLDGKWESIYRKNAQQMPMWRVKAEGAGTTWPLANAWYESASYEYSMATWEDFFDLRDEVTWTAGPQVVSGVSKLKVYVGQTTPDNPEITGADELQPNPIARPEIWISRLDAKEIALQPNAPVDLDGNSALDATGKPQKLRYAPSGAPTAIGFAHDLGFEQKLLVDYFYRNHSYRRSPSLRPTWRTTSIRSVTADATHGDELMTPQSMSNLMKAAGTGWGTDVLVDSADTTDFANWIATSATLKGIVAHSNPKLSAFPNDVDAAAYTVALGSTAFAWRRESDGSNVMFYPDVTRLGPDVQWAMMRTIHAGARTPLSRGTFYFHEGCDVTNPGNETEHIPWNDPAYGLSNLGDSTLFFLNGLSLYGRAKVYNDRPTGFPEGLVAPDATLGDGWRAHFDREAAQASLANSVYAHKRVYYWTLVGDWTLRLK